MKSKKKHSVKLAIVGTGGMAAVHAESFSAIAGCEIVAACDVDGERVRAFSDKHGIPQAFTDTASMLSSAEFDAVTIVTPDAFHSPVAIACMKAGKHVLCEKPLAMSYPEAKKMVSAAKRAGVINMVNFSYRNAACIQGAAAAIRKGAIGEIRHVEASYLQAWLPSKIWGDWRKNPAWLWRLSTSHGSKGVLGDVGVHIVDFATFPCGPVKEVFCRLKTFQKAPGNEVKGYQLDANDSAILNVEFANGALGTIHTSRWVGGHANRLALKIAGTKGTIAIDLDASRTSYQICNGKDLDKAVWREVECPVLQTNYERFITAIRTGKPGEPDFARGAEVQRVLDACFESDQKRLPVHI